MSSILRGLPSLLALALVFLAPPLTAQTTWDCGGEGEIPCGCQTDFFWENGNLFADRGLIASGFRVLGPVKFNAADWVNLNRVDMTLAADLIKVQLPALQAELAGLGVGDFLRSECLGIFQDGSCWVVPPKTVTIYGQRIGGVCTPWPVSGDCDHEETTPGVPSTSFNWYPDLSRPGWAVPDHIRRFLADASRVLAQFPPAVRDIPGNPPTLSFPVPSPNSLVDLSSFQSSVASLKSFFVTYGSFFNRFRDLVLDFTDPPPTARCLNDTRQQGEVAAFQGTWAHWALASQREFSKDEPFNWSTRLGTHNAFNNEADGYLAANQHWSMTDQLNLGSRYLSLDLHWYAEGNGKLRLSHAQADQSGAGPRDRYYANAIKEIARWLERNPGEVVYLSFEDRSTNTNGNNAPDATVIDPLEKYLGGLIYRRVEGNRPFANGTNQATGQWPSLQQLRDLGKRVMVDGSLDHGSNIIWTDMPGGGGGIGGAYARNFSNDVANLQAYGNGGLIGPFDDLRGGSQYETRSFLDSIESAGYLTASDIALRLPYNIGNINLDMLHAQQFSGSCPGIGHEYCADPDERIAALIWSWAPGQPEDALGGPDNGEDAAIMNGSTGRWESRNPGETHYFACARMRGLDPLEIPDRLGKAWRITKTGGTWWDSESAVAALNRELITNGIDDDCNGVVDDEGEGDYVFAAPVNGLQNESLRRALVVFRGSHEDAQVDVWIACHDLIEPGRWMLSRSFPGAQSVQHPVSVRLGQPNSHLLVPAFGARIPTNEITIEFWQKAVELRPQFTVSMTADNESNRVGIHSPWEDGFVYWDFGNALDGSGSLVYRPPANILGTWQHFAMVASRSGNYMKIFRNGVEEASKSGFGGYENPLLVPWPLFLGAGPAGGEPAFRGELRDVRIWSVARTESQIRETLFHRVSPTAPGLVANWRMEEGSGLVAGDAVGQTPAILEAGAEWVSLELTAADRWSAFVRAQDPLVFLHLDEKPGCDVATDSSGHALHGRYTNAVLGLPSWSTALGSSVGFRQATGSGVFLRNLGSLPELTLSLLVKSRSLVDFQSVLSGGLYLGILAGGALDVRLKDQGPGSLVIPGAIPDTNAWHHLMVIYEGRARPGILRVFVDGTEREQRKVPASLPVDFQDTRLGDGWVSPGAVDEFVLFPRALGDAELQALTQANLEAAFPSFTRDIVGQRLGYLRGGARFSPDGGGRSGLPGDRALDLGGASSESFVRISDVAFLNSAGAADQIAISGWQKLRSIRPSLFLWGTSPQSAEQRGLGVHLPWDDLVVFFDTAGCCADDQRLSRSIEEFPAFQASPSQAWWFSWHHVLFQKKHGTKEIWIDGQLLVRGEGARPLPADFTELILGADRLGQAGMDGLVDDLAVFGTFLSPADVSRLAAGEAPTGLSAQSGLMAFWNFDDSPAQQGVRIVSGSVEPGGLRLRWLGAAARYQVQRTERLSDPVWTPVLSTSELQGFVPRSSATGFFRVITE